MNGVAGMYENSRRERVDVRSAMSTSTSKMIDVYPTYALISRHLGRDERANVPGTRLRRRKTSPCRSQQFPPPFLTTSA